MSTEPTWNYRRRGGSSGTLLIRKTVPMIKGSIDGSSTGTDDIPSRFERKDYFRWEDRVNFGVRRVVVGMGRNEIRFVHCRRLYYKYHY